MTRHLLLVHADPANGSDDDFNNWYDDIHLPDVLAVSGFVAAQRYIAAPSVHGGLPPRRNLAIYGMETDDLPAALAAATKHMHFDPAFDRAAHHTYAFTAVSPRLEASPTEAIHDDGKDGDD